jgi:hypothetical protein
LLIDLQKAYDSVDREILWELLEKRCRDESEKAIVKLMMKLHKESTIQVGENEVNAEMGLPQGSVLSPFLFNVYLGGGYQIVIETGGGEVERRSISFC